MIEAAESSRSYGPVLAVNGVTFKVDQGEIVGFLGPNGAGKTTTMRMLAGLLRAGSGRASIAGHDVVSAGNQARAHLGYMPEAACANQAR